MISPRRQYDIIWYKNDTNCFWWIVGQPHFCGTQSQRPCLGLPPSALCLLFRSLQGSDGGAVAAPQRHQVAAEETLRNDLAQGWMGSRANDHQRSMWLPKFRNKLQTTWTNGKTEIQSQRRERQKKESQRRGKVRRRRMQVREKINKSGNIVIFPMFCGSGGLKTGLAKATGAEPSGQMRDEELHTTVAWSRFGCQNATNTSALEHVWTLRCPKRARRYGAKHISK